MEIAFSKYQGTGNDFVIIDNRDGEISIDSHDWIAHVCDRKYGVGADGLMLLQNHSDYDFEMVYFNADGYQTSMCGNGGRCLVAFAQSLGVFERECSFLAIDGPHHAVVLENGEVKLHMIDVADDGMKIKETYSWLDTGSPHHIEFVEDVALVDVKSKGAEIRYGELYGKEGSNVNFVEEETDHLLVRTYERGVEDETLSCGTGVTAVALAYAKTKELKDSILLRTLGGDLIVSYARNDEDNGFIDIYLQGAATFVFNGAISK